MPKIKQLSLHEAHKIAAGEVIERPANIVKELIENALDAQAANITIEIKAGGKQLIRVTDNGCGMDATDARFCFAKHATSKITHIDELQNIATFGFRGEALASIAAVSKVKLTTKETHTLEGIQLALCNEIITHEESVACITGTDICITDLFFNIPARKKFLKTDETEYRQIVHLFQAFCLANLSQSFTLIADGKQAFHCPAVSTLETRYAQLWDHSLASAMLSMTMPYDTALSLTGMISHHQRTRYDRNGIFLFVNNRWIKNNKLISAFLQGYAHVLPSGQFPFATLLLTLDPTKLDINIHPRKEEVQFLHPRIVEQFVQKAVKQTLESHLSAQLKKPVTLAAYHHNNSVFTTRNTEPIVKQYEKNQSYLFNAAPFAQDKSQPPFIAAQTQPSAPQSTNMFDEPKQPEHQHKIAEQPLYRLIGQFHKTYLLLEQDDGLFLIDQHAAHERILYESFANRFEQAPIVDLLFPQIITVLATDISYIMPHLQLFHNNGMVLDVAGNNQLVVRSISVHLKNVPLEELVRQIIGWIVEYHHLDESEFKKRMHDLMHTQMACKAAVKAGDELNQEMMEKLLHDLYTTPNRFTCPHGRPTGYLLDMPNIEKKFKRDYKR